MVLRRSVGIFGYLWGPTGMLPGDPVDDLFWMKHDDIMILGLIPPDTMWFQPFLANKLTWKLCCRWNGHFPCLTILIFSLVADGHTLFI